MGKIETQLKKAGAVVYALSNEEAAALKKMKEAEKLGDTFVFLSDREAKGADNYAGHYNGQTMLNPATFVIGKDGKILYKNTKVNPAEDAKLVSEFIEKLSKPSTDAAGDGSNAGK